MPYEPGTRFGKLVVIDRAPDWISPTNPKAKHKIRYHCKCDCGNETIVMATHLASGHTISCGCVNRAIHSQRMTNMHLVHGYANHPIYIIYDNMVARCYNPNATKYHAYGGRGIKICKEWYDPEHPRSLETFREFFNWSMLNGYKEGLTIDRINVDGDYTPDNCRYVNSQTRYIEFNGELYPISTLAYVLGVNPHDFYNWLYYRNFDISALTKTFQTPLGPITHLIDRNGNIVPTNVLWFVSKNGEYIAQNDYVEPEPTLVFYNIGENGFITGPLI